MFADTNLMTSVDRPNIEDRILKYLREDDEVKEFIASLPKPQDKLLVWLIYATGMHIPEVCKLRVEHINFKKKTILVLGNGGKFHTVGCDQATLSMIQKYLDGRTKGLVFSGYQGLAITPRYVQSLFREHAPKGITPQKFRKKWLERK